MINEFEIIQGIKIKTNDRILVVGKTGTGKTHLVKKWMLSHYDSYVFHDVKHENNDVEHDIISKTPKELEKSITENKKILYQPITPEEDDFNEICRIIFEHKNTTLYVDEASRVTTPSRITYWHNVILTQGRSYNVGIINASQRPRAIHNTLISESEHLFIFFLNLDTDISKMRQLLGDGADDIKYLTEQYFIYHSVRANKSFMFKPIISKEGESPKLEQYIPNLDDYIIKRDREV